MASVPVTIAHTWLSVTRYHAPIGDHQGVNSSTQTRGALIHLPLSSSLQGARLRPRARDPPLGRVALAGVLQPRDAPYGGALHPHSGSEHKVQEMSCRPIQSSLKGKYQRRFDEYAAECRRMNHIP